MEHRFRICAPLLNFFWDGDYFEFAPGLFIQRQAAPSLPGMEGWLSDDEWESVSNVSHWLIHEHLVDNVPSAGEIENLVLLSLWVVKPTGSQIAFRFQTGLDNADGQNSRQRLLDRFMWIRGSIDLGFSTSDLHAASHIYAALSVMYSARGRLNNALLLTLGGCWAHDWQVSLICHAAAAEALLTYSTGPGITQRLATSYACLTESVSANRNAAFAAFRDLYTTRSDIMHGRTHRVGAADRLPTLVRFQGLLRRLWTVICSSPALMDVLEGTDGQRKAYFQELQQGYSPSP